MEPKEIVYMNFQKKVGILRDCSKIKLNKLEEIDSFFETQITRSRNSSDHTYLPYDQKGSLKMRDILAEIQGDYYRITRSSVPITLDSYEELDQGAYASTCSSPYEAEALPTKIRIAFVQVYRLIHY